MTNAREVRWVVAATNTPEALTAVWPDVPLEHRIDTYMACAPNASLKLRNGDRLEEKQRTTVATWTVGAIAGHVETWSKRVLGRTTGAHAVTGPAVCKHRKRLSGVEIAYVHLDGFDPAWSIAVRLDRPHDLSLLFDLPWAGSLTMATSMSYPHWLSRVGAISVSQPSTTGCITNGSVCPPAGKSDGCPER